VDSTLAVEPGQLEVIDAMGISNWRVSDTMGTSSWSVADAMGAAPVTSTLISLGMSTNFSQFHATLVKYRFSMSNCVQSRITLFFTIFMTHSVMPRLEMSSSKRRSTQVVEERRITTRRMMALVLLLSDV
jgi:hypothetical protein